MAITYPNVKCKGSLAHYWKRIDKTELWKCKYCKAVIWLPSNFADATKHDYLVKTIGYEKAYDKAISRRPKVKRALTFLADMAEMRKRGITNKDISKAIVELRAPLTDDTWELRLKPQLYNLIPKIPKNEIIRARR